MIVRKILFDGMEKGRPSYYMLLRTHPPEKTTQTDLAVENMKASGLLVQCECSDAQIRSVTDFLARSKTVITYVLFFYTGRVNLPIILAMNISTLVTPSIHQTLSADVYSQLRDLLISGRVMPGEKLSLRSIADAFGVSVMPVREAVHRLVAEQALEMAANRYIRVPVLTVSQFREITSIRLNLEGQAAARAAELVGAEALREIEDIHEAFCKEFAQSAPDESRLIALNKELHFAIYNQAEMPILLQIVESLWLRIGPILNYDLRSGNERVVQRVQASHHAAMVDALKKRDPVAACESLQSDIKSAAEFILNTGALIVADAIKPVETD